MNLTNQQLQTLISMFPNYDRNYLTYISQNFACLEDLIEYLLTNSCSKIEVSLQEFKYNLQKDKKNTNKIEKNNARKYVAPQETKKNEYNYPNIFPVKIFANNQISHEYYRMKAQECYKMVVQSQTVQAKHKNILNTYYAMKIEENIQKAKFYDYKAAETILSKQDKLLDFHYLHVNECIDFLEDYIKYYKPNKIEIVMGKSTKIKPSVSAYLQNNGYKIEIDRVVSVVYMRNFT